MRKNRLFNKEKMKLSKNKKIILLTSIIGILTTSIVVPIVVLNSKQEDNKLIKKKEVQIEKEISAIEIKSKIKNKDLMIPKNIKTFSDEEILLAIKNQLKINNSSLTNIDLSKIKDNIWHLKPGKKTSVILKIESLGLIDSIKVTVTKQKNIKLWTKDSAIIKNSNITSGAFSSFIQDSSGNLWAMGGGTSKVQAHGQNPTKLQVLKRDGEQWEEDTTSGLTKGSNIIDGTYGVIFEDDFGNIWSMGKGTKIQVLVKNKDGTFANSWTDKNQENGEKLLQGSKINNGQQGTIFQDSFGNIWAMGTGSKLQVLVKNKDGSYASSWASDNTDELLKNSNISNGKDGEIFQDSFGNLWSMGYTSPTMRSSLASDYSLLQVLKVDPNSPTGYVNIGWSNDYKKGLLKNSQIIRGQEGKIFQDSFGNLWASGGWSSRPQVLQLNENGNGYVKTGWTNDYKKGLLKKSNVVPTRSSGFSVQTIFQDSFGNLWMHGYSKKPQVLKVNQNHDGYVTTGWSDENNPISGDKLLKNLKTHKGKSDSFWTFFQDSSKNLWAMGNQVKLQVLKAKLDGTGYVELWSHNNGNNGEELLKNSNIVGGKAGLVFEDSSKNLWSMGEFTKLQVYDRTLKRWKS